MMPIVFPFGIGSTFFMMFTHLAFILLGLLQSQESLVNMEVMS